MGFAANVDGKVDEACTGHVVEVPQATAEDEARVGPDAHFRQGCAAGLLCGCFGVAAQRVCWPTLRGNYGGCVGWVWQLSALVSVVAVMLIVEEVEDFGAFKTADLTRSECASRHGTWKPPAPGQPETCYLAECPKNYDITGDLSHANGFEGCSPKFTIVMPLLGAMLGLGLLTLLAAVFTLISHRKLKLAAGEAQPLVGGPSPAAVPLNVQQ